MLIHRTIQSNNNVHCPRQGPEHTTRHLTRHLPPSSTIVGAIQSTLKRANKKQSKGYVCRHLPCGRHRKQYTDGTSRLPRVLFVIPCRATALWLKLKVSCDDRPNYRKWSIRKTETEYPQTFFEARVPSESDLVPHITHGIRASNLCPMVEEVLYLNLFHRCQLPRDYINPNHNNSPYGQLQKWLRKLRRPRKERSPP
jgi:hypothetical protein